MKSAAGTEVATAIEAPDARRIAATVNALENVPIRELEAGILSELFFHCGQLKNSRVDAIMARMQPSADRARGTRSPAPRPKK